MRGSSLHTTAIPLWWLWESSFQPYVFLQSEKRSLRVNTRHSLEVQGNSQSVHASISHLLDGQFWGAFYRVLQKVPNEIECQLSIVINSSVPTFTEFSFFLYFIFLYPLLSFFPPPITSKINYLCTRVSLRHCFRMMNGRDKHGRR